MSAQNYRSRAKDHRPKVISFKQSLNGLNIAGVEDVLWPCHAFNISLPQKKKSSLNVFEETVLKITEVESGYTEKIALLTCLEKELVAFIQNRLNQLGLLNDRYALSERGQDLLNEWQNRSEGNLEYIVATVFVDLVSGKLLPYVATEQLSYKKIKSLQSKESSQKKGGFEHHIEFFINPTSEERIDAIQIRPEKDSLWKVVPDSSDIIKAIREFKKRHKRYALLNKDVDQYPPQVPIAEAISIHENPELVYLHCKAFIQKGNHDLLVTDGCGFGFSEIFANYLTSQDWMWITDMKQQGVVDKLGNDEGLNNKQKGEHYKYEEISKRVVKSKLALAKIKNLKVNSTHDESSYKQKIENGIKNLYAALEWSLRQVVAENPVSEWEQIFSSGNFRDNGKLLVGFSKKVGFSVNEKNHSILQVNAGAIRQIENCKVELQPLLALSIVGANSNVSHPIHRLVQNHAGFLSHALRLKKYRDPIEHGSSEALSLDDKILEELIEATIPMIISLVPDVAGDLGGADNVVSDGDINQQRYNASVELEKVLGAAFFSSIGTDIKEQLIRAELMLGRFVAETAIEIIKCYASVVQHALFDAVKDRRLEIKIETVRESAVEKIAQSGFYSAPDAIPEQISTVNPKRLDRAVQGSSTTLGAQLLAVFLLGSESELIELQKLAPRSVDIVAKLIRLRGHGNDEKSGIPRDDIVLLKNDVFKVIKIVTEVF